MNTISIENLKSGDCILCHGHNLLDCAIEVCSRSKFSHSAIILKDPYYIDEQLKGIYILESSLEFNPDVEDGKIHLGVQLQPIEVLLNDYKYNDLLVRPLQVEIPNINQKILSAYKELKDKPYNLDPIDWLAAKILIDDSFRVEKQNWFKKCFGNTEQQTKSFWCSAMVAFFYVRLGVLDKDCSFAILAPEHFRKKHDKEMPWVSSGVLGEETKLIA